MDVVTRRALLLVESGFIAGVSGLLGLVTAAWGIGILRSPPTLSRGRNFYGAVGELATPAMDWRVLAFMAAVCACTVLLFGRVQFRSHGIRLP
ncbi:MAG TPA: hypothetical protein VK933_15080 [Longimicrobiales bacterium]|nr:hypothetical protein [Longimicrobiales bacterium]